MNQRKLAQQRFGPARQPQHDTATVERIRDLFDQTGIFQPADQLGGAMWRDKQLLGQCADVHLSAAMPFDRQQRLMLARRQPGVVCRSGAEIRETPEQMTERRQLFVIILCKSICAHKRDP